MDSPAAPYRLLGADVSYYTAKIRAYLVHKRVPFVDVLATRAVFKAEILPRVGWPVIPVLITPEGATLQDTSEMVDALEARHPEPALIPNMPLRRFAALLFELYADEWIKVPALHYRWNYDREFAVLEFGRNNDPDRSRDEQIKIGEKIAVPFAGWLPLLGVTPRTVPAIEADYLGLLDDFSAHFSHHPYVFGDAITLADCALYGPFHAHLFRDPNSGAIMRARAPRVVAWLHRMQQVSNSLPAPGADEIPASLYPVLKRLSRGYIPILSAQIAAFQRWIELHPNSDIPRTFGSHEVRFGAGTPYEVSGPRALFTYDQWMWQRARTVYAAADPVGRGAIEQFAEAIGALALLEIEFRYPLVREQFRLRLAAP
jgi:glutathione S-transferase